MKKIIFTFILFLILITMFLFINKTHSPNIEQSKINNSIEQINKNTVSYNGWLHTKGANLENEKNELIQLRGLSSHGIEWFSDIITYENLEIFKKEWNINVFRIAMYTDSNGEGYIFNKEENIKKVCNIIDMAIKLDIYVIVDWHILNDNNPQQYKEESKLFFEEISKKYADIPNVIYEICNEPNGDNVTWKKDVKPYANEIIPIIRKNSEKSLIIVGTPDWCKQLNKAADDPLQFQNIVYACHFYSGTHGEELREKIDYCLEKNIPIFVSECGATAANGNGNLFLNEFNEWINYLNSKNISWVYWSFCNKDESSAILLPEYKVDNINLNTSSNNDVTNEEVTKNNSIYIENTNNSNTINNYLTKSGKFIKEIFQSYK